MNTVPIRLPTNRPSKVQPRLSPDAAPRVPTIRAVIWKLELNQMVNNRLGVP
ncbi:hypothetical protein D3C85_1894820 [compost metagenome]